MATTGRKKPRDGTPTSLSDTPMSDDVIEDLPRIVNDATARMLAMSDSAASQPRTPGQWSRKEIVGHLIDAVNNQARFVRAQIQDDLVFPGYDQDGWVRVQQYRGRSWPELVEIWRVYNVQIAAVMRATPSPDAIVRGHGTTCRTSAFSRYRNAPMPRSVPDARLRGAPAASRAASARRLNPWQAPLLVSVPRSTSLAG